AEDGIRDDLVTGVQTCALPISVWHRLSECRIFGKHYRLGSRAMVVMEHLRLTSLSCGMRRSASVFAQAVLKLPMSFGSCRFSRASRASILPSSAISCATGWGLGDWARSILNNWRAMRFA